MKSKSLVTLAALSLLTLGGPAIADSKTFVVGQKIDSGLGELPHYSKWADPRARMPVRIRVAGESLDSGLGELPHYSRWLDRSGKHPMGEGKMLLSQALR